MDAYLWLAYRLHVLTGDRLVTWTALKAQFGSGYKELYHFKNRWPRALELALAVYPAAKLQLSGADGEAPIEMIVTGVRRSIEIEPEPEFEAEPQHGFGRD